MVGFVIVSHSSKLAEGVVDLTKMMAPDVPIAAAGGMEDGNFGTSFDKIYQAVEEVYSEDGVIIVSAGVDTEYMCISIPPEVATRGFIYEKENEELIGKIAESAHNSLMRNFAKGIDNINVLRTRLRDDIAEYARRRTKHRPMIVVMLNEVRL